MQTEQHSEAAKPLPQWRLSLPNRPLTGLTVLVIEDSRFASEAVRLLCLKSGARIRRADCLRSADRHLRTYRPAVVIVDLGLPDGDGVPLIAEMNRAEHRVPVILAMSGDADRAAEAMAAGADGFLPKPVESLAVFQQAILSRLPAGMAGTALRALPDDVIQPDASGLRDDLTHVAEILSSAQDTTEIDYIARFLAGVARSARDPALEAAAAALARDHDAGNALATDLARISGMVHDRLAHAAEM
ncbi:response regulator [Paracoccus aestuarii]|uniref:Response regulator n=1 Tax=Paracoccus aestuarii TaxID=453842 RepID=A0A418ZVR7_9RHOB|nr:response regulator [Paracoccus aestuarii]RJL03942.1 response regulator [Paracoccus aestuarii]WCQ98693.1 response regulator [Paracoccus aestuarii]